MQSCYVLAINSFKNVLLKYCNDMQEKKLLFLILSKSRYLFLLIIICNFILQICILGAVNELTIPQSGIVNVIRGLPTSDLEN